MSVSKKNVPEKEQPAEIKKIVPKLVEQTALPKAQAEILIPAGKVLIYNLDSQGNETSWFFYNESTAHRFYGDKSRFLIKKKKYPIAGTL